MRQTLRVLMLACSVLAIGAASPAFAVGSCEVPDAEGDLNRSPGRGFDGAAYQDIVSTAVERAEDGSFVFSMDVAEAIPAQPELRTPNGLLLWMWGMNTEIGVPRGLPLGNGVAGILDFWIHLVWDGSRFDAVVIDRRPAAHGGDPVVTQVPFAIAGETVTLVAPASLFGGVEAFSWGSSTWIWPTHLGTTGAHRVDQAPDVGGSPCNL